MQNEICLGVLSICFIVSSALSSNIRFPADDPSQTGGERAEVQQRFSHNEASHHRLPHFFLPQVPSGQNPFGHGNPGGYAEGIIVGGASGRPPPSRHYKPNNKIPDKMKPVQRVPYRVVSKPLGQHQTRKPLFSPKDTRIHADNNIKHSQQFPKEKEFHHKSKPDGLTHANKEFNQLKPNKYFIKGSPHPAQTHPYRFVPTPASQDIREQLDKNNAKEKQGYSGMTRYSPYHQNEHKKYHKQTADEDFQVQTSYFNHKPYVPVEEDVDEGAYVKNKESFTNPHKQSPLDGYKKTTPQTIDSLYDYINKWSDTANYHHKEFADMEEPTFDKEWLSGSEWVPIHAPAPTSTTHQYAPHPASDNSFSAGSMYLDTPLSDQQAAAYNHRYSSSDNYPNTQSLFTNPKSQIDPYHLTSHIFQKPEVVMGKRAKSADINHSHEVSAVFMVKQ